MKSVQHKAGLTYDHGYWTPIMFEDKNLYDWLELHGKRTMPHATALKIWPELTQLSPHRTARASLSNVANKANELQGHLY